MGTLELKTDLHTIIDSIENEFLLRTLHDFLKQKRNSEEQGVWHSLTEAQKREILESFDESEKEENLIQAKRVFGVK